jgi:putative transposase
VVIYVDALVVKVQNGGMVQNKAAYLPVGVDGFKHVLGLWLDGDEGCATPPDQQLHRR